jgi:hypothetical protein
LSELFAGRIYDSEEPVAGALKPDRFSLYR